MTDGRRGPTILAVMGLVWWVFGSLGFLPSFRGVLIAFGLVATGGALIAIRRYPRVITKLDRNTFLLSLAFEGVGIVAVCTALIALHLASYVLSAIAVIVGLHFIGMSRATDRRDYLLLAASLCAVGAVTTLFPMPLRIQSAGLTVGITLWAWALICKPAPTRYGTD